MFAVYYLFYCFVNSYLFFSKLYVVVYEIKKNYIVIADPAIGIKRIKINTFKEIWSGVLFLIEPETNFYKTNESKGFFKFTGRNYHFGIFAVLVGTIISGFLRF